MKHSISVSKHKICMTINRNSVMGVISRSGPFDAAFIKVCKRISFLQTWVDERSSDKRHPVNCWLRYFGYNNSIENRTLCSLITRRVRSSSTDLNMLIAPGAAAVSPVALKLFFYSCFISSTARNLFRRLFRDPRRRAQFDDALTVRDVCGRNVRWTIIRHHTEIPTTHMKAERKRPATF